MKKAVTLATVLLMFLLTSLAVTSAYSYGPSYSSKSYRGYNHYYHQPYYNSYHYTPYHYSYAYYHRPNYRVVYPFSRGSYGYSRGYNRGYNHHKSYRHY